MLEVQGRLKTKNQTTAFAKKDRSDKTHSVTTQEMMTSAMVMIATTFNSVIFVMLLPKKYAAGGKLVLGQCIIYGGYAAWALDIGGQEIVMVLIAQLFGPYRISVTCHS